MHEIHTLAFTLYKVFLTVAQLMEVTRREFIDTDMRARLSVDSLNECLFLTSDAYVPLMFCRRPNRVNAWLFSRLAAYGLQ